MSSAIIAVWFDLGVVGGAADVRGEHHLVHVEQRMALRAAARRRSGRGRRPARWPDRERLGERVEVVQAGPGRVEVDRRRGASRRTRSASIIPSVSGVGARRASRRRRRSASMSSSESWVASSAYGSNEMTCMPSPSSRHFDGPADGAEPDEPGGPAGELPRPEALVGDRCRRGRPRRLARRGRPRRRGGWRRTAGRRSSRRRRRRCGRACAAPGCPCAVAPARRRWSGSPRVEPITRSGRSRISPCTKSASQTRTVAPSSSTSLGQLGPSQMRSGLWSIHGS